MDSDDHVSKYESVALLNQYFERVKCRVFLTTLVEAAQQWLKQLPSELNASFVELYETFTRQFASVKKSPKSSLYFMTVAKFNMVAVDTPRVDTKIKIHAFI